MGNEDDASEGNSLFGFCTTCGQTICSACKFEFYSKRDKDSTPTCPLCRAAIGLPYEVQVKQARALCNDRSPGRHTGFALQLLGVYYLNGLGVEKDEEEAIRCFEQGAELGNALCQHNLGLCAQQATPPDMAKALHFFSLAADQNNVAANMALALVFKFGAHNIEQNDELSFKHGLIAAKHGKVAEAQTLVGTMYQRGIGIAQNSTKAIQFWTLAAEQGAVRAQVGLVKGYTTLVGHTSMRKALHWAQLAAEQGCTIGLEVFWRACLLKDGAFAQLPGAGEAGGKAMHHMMYRDLATGFPYDKATMPSADHLEMRQADAEKQQAWVHQLGRLVEIRGLTSASDVQYNGRIGRVQQSKPHECAAVIKPLRRVTVEFVDDGGVKTFELVNITTTNHGTPVGYCPRRALESFKVVDEYFAKPEVMKRLLNTFANDAIASMSSTRAATPAADGGAAAAAPACVVDQEDVETILK